MSRVVATVMLAMPVAIKLLLCSGDYAKAWSQAVPRYVKRCSTYVVCLSVILNSNLISKKKSLFIPTTGQLWQCRSRPI